MDGAGNIYGTALSNGSCVGVVFQLDSAGKQVAVHCVGGEPGFGRLLRDASGNLYGTTESGGLSGYGTVFKLDTAGKETVLHDFAGPPDGKASWAGLVGDGEGNFYGTTVGGGNPNCDCGIVFKLNKTGKESILHTFTLAPDGGFPFSGLLRDAAGNLYGTTYVGGAHNVGAVFKLSKTEKLTVLYSFSGGKDGEGAFSGVIRDAAGNFYGTTAFGGFTGCSGGCGTVFKLDTKGKETVLYRFAGGRDGQEPLGGLVMDAAGNLYGTTAGKTTPSGKPFGAITERAGASGTNAFGTVFKLDTKGKETVLHRFTGKGDGKYPYAGLVMDAAGNLYGTAVDGGVHGCGTVFKVTP